MPSFQMIHFHITWLWIALALAVILVIVRGVWLYRASLTWPTADGVITLLQIERQRDAGTPSGHYFSATFTYDFRDRAGKRVSGNWRKDFSSEAGGPRDGTSSRAPPTGISLGSRPALPRPFGTTSEYVPHQPTLARSRARVDRTSTKREISQKRKYSRGTSEEED